MAPSESPRRHSNETLRSGQAPTETCPQRPNGQRIARHDATRDYLQSLQGYQHIHTIHTNTSRAHTWAMQLKQLALVSNPMRSNLQTLQGCMPAGFG